MADWYISSAAYATYAAWQATHAYVIGDIVTPVTPVAGSRWAFRCTTAGTSGGAEPAWPTNTNSTVTSGTAVFTNVTGQSTYFWTAAGGDLQTIFTAITATLGNRYFLSSDHSDTIAAGGSGYLIGNTISSTTALQFLCVNRAGSTPPVAADITTGASVACSSNSLILCSTSPSYHQGIAYSINGSSTAIYLGNKTNPLYLKNCSLFLNTSSSSASFQNSTAVIVLDNTTIQFGNTAQLFNPVGVGPFEIDWINTPSAIVGTPPTLLFNTSSQVITPFWITFRGIDLSSLTGTLLKDAVCNSQILLDSCKINSGLTAYGSVLSTNSAGSAEVCMVNCDNGSHFVSEIHNPYGDVTTEFTTIMSGGATNEQASFAHKMVTTSIANKFVSPLHGFWLDVENTTTGSPKTASVEIISSTTLMNDEVALYIEYEGTAGTPVTSFANSFISTPLTTPANVPTSSASWISPPATPIAQTLQVTFTPQRAGRLRGQVKLGKASTTMWYNPEITIS